MLLEQRVIVKVVSNKIIIRYECDNSNEVFGFVLNNASAMQLSGMLEAAVKNIGKSKEPYEVGISI